MDLTNKDSKAAIIFNDLKETMIHPLGSHFRYFQAKSGTSSEFSCPSPDHSRVSFCTESLLLTGLNRGCHEIGLSHRAKHRKLCTHTHNHREILEFERIASKIKN